MKPPVRRFLLLLPVVVLVTLAILYLAVDTWLESAGGRRALEQELAEQLGVPVTLQGEFNIMLLPAIGVSGTELEIASTTSDQPLASSEHYEVVIAVPPLIDKRLRIENFVLENIQLSKSVQGSDKFDIEKVMIRGFETGQLTPFTIETGGMGTIEGEFKWTGGHSILEMDCEWPLEGVGQLSLQLLTSFTDYSGYLLASFRTAGSDDVIDLSVNYEYRPAEIRFTELLLESGGQEINGAGCLLAGEKPSLNLDLTAGLLDLDEIRRSMPVPGSGDDALPLDIRLRLTAEVARASGALAHNAEFILGEEPACPGQQKQ